MDKKRGVVVIGTGLIAKFHARAVNASEKLRLAGFVGRTMEKASALSAEFGGGVRCARRGGACRCAPSRSRAGGEAHRDNG